MKSITASIIAIVLCFYAQAQEVGRYRISFTDKANSIYSIDAPEAYLSAKSIERRTKHSIAIIEEDLPVNQWYIDSIVALGGTICNVSKWFNSAVVLLDSASQFSAIQQLPFVQSVEWIAPPHKAQPDATALKRESFPDVPYEQFYNDTINIELYGDSYKQINMMSGLQIHADGYMGQGMTIAVLDAGFLHVDSATAFAKAWQENRIVAYKDISGAGVNVWKEGYHGMAVLSLIASYAPTKLIGTAPRAEYVLLRTEEGATEYRVEEDNWTAAAEFADSIGADVVSTSLGYSSFDDSTQNYTYQNMDGNTTRISKAANKAASKGMLMFVSAGNSGASSWKYITAPADSDSVISVGACYKNGVITNFSSRGPSKGASLKPDVVALGYYPVVMNNNGTLKSYGAGTSFSNPILAGMTACLWQEFYDLPAAAIKQALLQSAHRFFVADTVYGHGIPNIEKARLLLKTNYLKESFTKADIYPNPFTEMFKVRTFANPDQNISITLYDSQGKSVLHKEYEIKNISTPVEIPEADNLPSGFYLASIILDREQHVVKVIKR